ncbi:MAG: TauD/TfdA family dioxygenase [Candidatus Thiodiazotropha taylori]|nr:TauD/TfdA family dioxygenase [Candidatus Thiodiazotropha taylori]MCG7942097.1 TauD/TfdA family dioxygenase [Candidatus Thiodiazotropha taylori]
MPSQALSPFNPDNSDSYASWRDAKLKHYPSSLEALIVEIGDPRNITQAEHDRLQQLCCKSNMAIWAGLSGHDADKQIIRQLGSRFGLQRLDHNMCADNDAISSLTVQSDALHKGYIPYSDRPIAWHTDGYYNDLQHQIHGLLLHCVNPAAKGGENDLLDHEIVFIRIMDENPDYIRALMHPQAMTIPANVVDGNEIRPARSGPVFAIYPDGHLHMRYTDRSRSIAWREDACLSEAVSFLKSILYTPSEWHFKGKLMAGQGLICNNVLHTRSGFEDGDSPRLIYRARYFDRLHGCSAL